MFANIDAGLSILGVWFLAADEHSLCLPAVSAAGWLSGPIFFILGRFWGSEQPKQITGAGSFPETTCKSAYLLFGINSAAIYWKKRYFKGFGASEVCHLAFAPPLLFYTRSLDFFFFSPGCWAGGDSSATARSFPPVPVPAAACHEDGTVGACSEEPRKMMWKWSRDC